jgi:hypothetical protein
MHRVTVTDEHYDMVRQYMVATKLPHVRAAVERMIEFAAVEVAEEGNGSLRGVVNGRNSRRGMQGPGTVPTPSHKG